MIYEQLLALQFKCRIQNFGAGGTTWIRQKKRRQMEEYIKNQLQEYQAGERMTMITR